MKQKNISPDNQQLEQVAKKILNKHKKAFEVLGND